MTFAAGVDTGGVRFGTSGIRGLVAEITDEVCFAYVSAYLQWMRACDAFHDGGEVALAADLRPSSPRILQAAIAAIRHAHGVPQFFGYVPTPCLCLTAFARRIPSMMVTGSHIPADRNGIKFNHLSSEFSKRDEEGLLQQRVSVPKQIFDHQGNLVERPPLPPVEDITGDYIDRYRAFFGETALRGVAIGVYQHSSVARDLIVTLIKALGGRAVTFGRKDAFHVIDTEALGPADIALLQNWAQRHQVDGILSSDGDADRPLLTDSAGQFIRGDLLGVIAAKHLRAAFVATPISSNTALEKSAHFEHIRRTRIGSPYVMAALQEAPMQSQAIIGYEANGGFILANQIEREGRTLNALPTRDFALPAISALVSAREQNTTLAGLIKKLPHRVVASDRLSNIASEASLALLEALASDPTPYFVDAQAIIRGRLERSNQLDGLRLTFSSGDIVHLRPSGNAPELRLYAESDTNLRAEAILEWMRNFAKHQLSKESAKAVAKDTLR